MEANLRQSPPEIEHPDAAHRFLTVRAVADALGVTDATVYRMIAGGKLPVLRLGGRTVRISQQALDRLIQSGTTAAPAPAPASPPATE